MLTMFFLVYDFVMDRYRVRCGNQTIVKWYIISVTNWTCFANLDERTVTTGPLSKYKASGNNRLT